MEHRDRKSISFHREQLKELEKIFDFALTVMDILEKTEPLPQFGGLVEIDTPCECGCFTIAEIYAEGKFRCLQCGKVR